MNGLSLWETQLPAAGNPLRNGYIEHILQNFPSEEQGGWAGCLSATSPPSLVQGYSVGLNLPNLCFD